MKFYLFIFLIFNINTKAQVHPQGFFVSPGIEAVSIGTQVWMRNNLNVVTYNNGDPIPSPNDFGPTFAGAYADYQNNPINSNTYGRLYNWYAVVDARGICPVGWRVPSETDFVRLTNFVLTGYGSGGINTTYAAKAGQYLKEIGLSHWTTPNTGATDDFRFRAYAAGRKDRSAYGLMGTVADFWSTTTWTTTTEAIRFSLYYNNIEFARVNTPKYFGLSVRCIQN